MTRFQLFSTFFLMLPLITSCMPQEAAPSPPTQIEPSQTPTVQVATATVLDTPEVTPMTSNQQTRFADVLSVQVTGNPSNYQFAVQVASPDTGCDQFADWWEIVSADGQLLYRRILLHSHVGEQPFVRSGGPVDIAEDDVVFVRAHMNTVGYGGQLMKGTIQGGFEPAEVEAGFGSDLERVPPQPGDCAF